DSDAGQSSLEAQDEELAQKLNNSLQLKRKREEDCHLSIEDSIERAPNIENMQITMKKKKRGAFAEQMAEEAGPSKPPPEP
ncbi:hypothetical protein PIB30_074465, partial [Stylosanthes scabra]|nr:hypothetical protein [Stylosanthes scabra]